jgi:hypothetical protein
VDVDLKEKREEGERGRRRRYLRDDKLVDVEEFREAAHGEIARETAVIAADTQRMIRSDSILFPDQQLDGGVETRKGTGGSRGRVDEDMRSSEIIAK